MEDPLEPEASVLPPEKDQRPAGWLRLGVITAASALAGGMAVAWFYRKTLSRLRQAEIDQAESPCQLPEPDPDEE